MVGDVEMSTTVAGGWPPSPANDPGIRKVVPASYIIYNDPYDQKYHAVADGSLGLAGTDVVNTDAVTVIQKAIDLLTVAGGGIIFFKPGTYPVGTTAINPKSNISLIGENAGSTIIQLATGTSRHILTASTTISNFTLENLTFDGNSANQAEPSSRANGEFMQFVIGTVTNLAIEGCVIQNTRTGAALGIGNNVPGVGTASNVLIDGCSFLNNGVVGATFSTDHIHMGRVSDSRIVNSY